METEAQIRDFFATNLYLIEKDLSLIKTEYKIKSDSVYGFIDIFAKDKFGNLVIIEIKKSRNTARQAIHELHKYIGLIKESHKVQDGKIRCVLISSDWNELLTPFSNFVHRTPTYQIQGFKFDISEDGIPKNCEKINILTLDKLTSTIEICPEHIIYLYKDEKKKVEAETQLKEIIESLDCLFLVFYFKYQGNNKRVIYPFAHYVVPFVVPFEKRHILETDFGIFVEKYENDAEIDTEFPYRFEEEVLAYIGNEYHSFRDDTEIGYPNKFDSLFAQGWIIEKVIRFGEEILAEEIYSDEALIKKVRGYEGSHTSVYHEKVLPSNKVRWKEVRQELAYTLIGNHDWEEVVNLYLNEIEQNHSDDTISITIYNPCNTTITLVKLLENNAFNFLPMLEIAIEENETGKIKLLVSMLHWNGRIINQSAENMIDSIWESLNGFFAYNHFGETYIKEDIVLLTHGLFYDFAEFSIENEQIINISQILIDDEKLSRSNSVKENSFGIKEFVENHLEYLIELRQIFIESSIGIVNTT